MRLLIIKSSIMKAKSIWLWVLLVVTAVSSCKYDDGELWDKVNSLDNRVTNIEEQLTQMNTNISSISTIVNAIDDNLFITSLEETANGYSIKFSNGETATLTNGTDGAAGKDAPVIGFDEFEGKYYWTQTIDGQQSWLTDDAGNKLPVTGADAVTPQLKVNTEGFWMVSYDNGLTYAEVLDEAGNPVKAVGEDGKDGEDGIDGSDGTNGDSWFSEVKVENGYVVFVLIDGTEIRIAMSTNLTDVINVNGIIDNPSNESYTIETLISTTTITNNSFSIQSPQDDVLPQLITVNDKNGNTIMMARDFYSSNQPYEINANTTALALITLHPLFALIEKDHFDELIAMIQQSPQYSTFVAEVEKSIENQKDIFDTNNTELLIASSNLMESICGERNANDIMSRAIITNWEQLNINDPYPFLMEINNTILSITNTALSPAYDGTVSHNIEGTRQLTIPTREGYGGWELLNQALYGWSSGEWGNLGNGEPVKFEFTYEGEYRFSFIRNEADFYANLVFDLLKEFGVPNMQENLIKDITDDIAEQMLLQGIFAVNPNQDPMDYLLAVGEYTIDYIKSDLFKETAEGNDFHKRFPNASTHLEKVGKALKYWSIIKGSSNALLRIGWRIKAPQTIKFCLCLYDNEITSCAEVELIKKESTDNQEGYAGQTLLEPIEVLVKANSEDGTLVETEYQKVKFEVVSGGGSVSERIVGTNGDFFASTSWTLGNSGEQKIRAVAIDMVTGEEISEPVYFTATLKETADITIRLDWNKLSGNTDIDLHTTDPFGEEIYYAHMQSASGGWLDRDDVIGPGPEHIYWQSAPNGNYLVQVHYFGSESGAITNYRVTINIGNQTFGPYTGSIAYHQLITIGTIIMPDGTVSRSSTKPIFIENTKKEEIYKEFPKK